MCSDIFCFPTLIETFGNIFLEAMASKCPVVTTNAPGARDLIKDGYNGLISPVDNQEEMIKNIELLFKDKKFRKKIIEGGLETVSNYRMADIVNSYNDLYFKLSKEKND